VFSIIDVCGGRRGEESVQVGEDDVDKEDEFAECCREEWRDKCWDKEDDREDGLEIVRKLPDGNGRIFGTAHDDFLIEKVLSVWTAADEERG
jgi:hypothetical protein